MKLNWGALAWILPLATVGAGEIPELVLPAGVGVNIHFVTGHKRDLDLIADAGFKFIRMDFGWAAIERQKGQYDWKDYEELLGNLDQRGLRAVFILDYSNPLYEDHNASPQHPESVAAFATWAAASAKHFQGRHVLWEIWNEPNISFWKPKPDVRQYTTMALATCKAIRQAAPAEAIIAPASSTFPWSFLESFLQSGVLEQLDAVSVHPYRGPHIPPESAAADYQRLRQLIERYAPESKKQMPILSGEWGYSTFGKGVSLEAQAAFAARQQLSNLLNGVPLSIWYDWKNDGEDPNENEHNFGTVLPDLKPKPSYLAIQTLTRELAGYRIAQRLLLPSEKDYALLCTNAAGAKKLAAWTSAEPHSVPSEKVDSKSKRQLSGVRINGEPFTPKQDGERLVLDLTGAPQYISF